MAKVFCKYHSNIPARFHCKSCNVDLCSTCYKLEETKDGKKYVCPICLRPLTSLGMQNAITPFWERLPKFFSFPFNPYTLGLMVSLSISCVAIILLAVYMVIAPLSGLIGLIAYIATVTFIIYRYGFALLKYASEGYLDPYNIEGGGGMLKSNLIPIKMFFVLILVSGISFLIAYFGNEEASIAFSIFISFITPASIMMMGVTGSFFHSINPIALAVIIIKVGLPYLALLFMVTTLSSGWYSIYYLMPRNLFMYLLMIPISIFISCYMIFVMFQMMGYVIYQYHEKLGYKVDVDFDETDESKSLNNNIDNETQEINILIHEGKLDEAKKRLLEKTKKSPNNIKFHEFLHNMLLKLGEYDSMSKHAQKFVVELIRKERFLQAAKICDNCAAHDKNFKISDPHHSITIAEEAINQGYYKTVVQLLNGFDKRFPSSPNMDKAAFLLAKGVCEGLGKDEIAIKILTNTINSFPASKLMQEMKEYLQFVKKLHASKG